MGLGGTSLSEDEKQVDTYEYSGSPVPFATFMVLFILTVMVIISGYFPSLLGLLVMLAGLFFILIPASIAINKQWEEAIILRFGKYTRLVGPGIFFKWPFVERFLRQDKRIQTLDASRQEVMTKDNISLVADAVVFMRVTNTVFSLIQYSEPPIECHFLFANHDARCDRKCRA